MFRTTAAIGFIAASFAASDIAQAQSYPPYYQAPPPYYRGAPPPPPAEWDIDDMPIGTVPGDIDRPAPPATSPHATATPDPYYRPTPPYPNSGVQRDPNGLPPPGIEPYPRPPAQAAVPVQPEPAYGPTGVRPPGTVSSEQMASLPPDIRPENGQQKQLDPRFRRQIVSFPTREPAGTIIIDTPNTYLYLVLGNGQALRYGVGVGREGFTWSGTQRIARMAEWPDWHPPAEMIERQPYLPRFMAGGPGNPLGARALYLGNTIYRIHGTNQPSTIGTFVSSGCIRLTNEDVEDLYGRVQVGTRVVVMPKSDATAATAPPYHPR